MESLPVEILQMTLSYLCMHCRDPTGFPHADTQEVRDDKRALAFLCRISRRISAVAYPILYHYYATGNMHLRQTVITRQRPIRNTPEPNLVQKFTRTIRQRPDLASYVDAMQVASWDLEINYRLTSPDSSSSDSSVSDSEVPPEVWEAASTLYAEHSRKPQPPTPIKDYSMLEGEVPDLIAAIQSCPRLQSLLVSYSDHDPIWPEKSWLGLRMPSIRRLGVIVGLSRQCTLYINFAGMQNMFPNVESIHASTGGLWILQRGTLPTKNPKDFLTKLKSLSIAGMRDPHLEELLTCLPGLERLEITNQNYDCSWRRALKPVQNRLKSLHISYHLKPHHGMKLWDVKFRHSERFRLCGALEELSLDCRLIRDVVTPYAPEARLASLLPPSIRVFRIRYLHYVMSGTLKYLADVAPTRFPHLKLIHIGVSECESPGNENMVAAMEEPTRRLFAAVGIDLLWMQDLVWEQKRPGRFLGSGINLTADIPLPVVPEHMIIH
ncbi:hypothetical protein CPAR01_08400 [Colletotrichum paranaense]|uniref:F-box domain-containing protein n=2 Tax=Colletotrichum acutatum species complex TaxID=2707335 RepID=A0ABQ9PUR3_9PEZI|nr:uncharacterized protein CPAR01_08400 [Colletotrichum paranaense]KAK0375235.1 hypothetical protein CLIM01_07410 [Colletotrichum limetticola]KAK1538287.1 hypothetical protein CPAR01_08400 [Colletotrichum paranaense]